MVTIPERTSGPTDDARDAWELAERLRVGSIKRRVDKDRGPFSELRAAVRSYTMLRDDVRRTKNRLRAVYRYIARAGCYRRQGHRSTRSDTASGRGSCRPTRPGLRIFSSSNFSSRKRFGRRRRRGSWPHRKATLP